MKSELCPSRPAGTAQPPLVAPTTTTLAVASTVQSVAPIALRAAISALLVSPPLSASAATGADHG